jgi:hypothetical protein
MESKSSAKIFFQFFSKWSAKNLEGAQFTEKISFILYLNTNMVLKVILWEYIFNAF